MQDRTITVYNYAASPTRYLEKELLEMQNPLPDSAGTFVSVPTVITAIQWTGNVDEIWNWTTAAYFYGPVPEEDGRPATPARLYVAANDAWLPLEIGEWIIRDELGFYPCKDAVFTKKYAPKDGAAGILVLPPALSEPIILTPPVPLPNTPINITINVSPDADHAAVAAQLVEQIKLHGGLGG